MQSNRVMLICSFFHYCCCSYWMSNGGKRLLFGHDKLHREYTNHSPWISGLRSFHYHLSLLRRQSWNLCIYFNVINWVGIVETEYLSAVFFCLCVVVWFRVIRWREIFTGLRGHTRNFNRSIYTNTQIIYIISFRCALFRVSIICFHLIDSFLKTEPNSNHFCVFAESFVWKNWKSKVKIAWKNAEREFQ